jgi:hypothetical protein
MRSMVEGPRRTPRLFSFVHEAPPPPASPAVPLPICDGEELVLLLPAEGGEGDRDAKRRGGGACAAGGGLEPLRLSSDVEASTTR